MAYRTSKPLHPTEWDEDLKFKNKRKGVKTKSLGTKTIESDIPYQKATISKETMRLKKTRSKSGKPTKVKAKSVSKVTTGANTKTKEDDSTKYVMAKTKKGHTKTKQISKKKYHKTKKRLQRKHNRGNYQS